ncbi:uncharacterized protein LOC121370476 [Gigantopelta aegis]|uniref:uncharacterized protein LOC121370476 n=1 Tax=Gigantopelta aegis TaxID=1735272 RepID=UPI001B88DEAF|nr:uncharacterized protein LOC121370476 [Gigantopelta aegis]
MGLSLCHGLGLGHVLGLVHFLGLGLGHGLGHSLGLGHGLGHGLGLVWIWIWIWVMVLVYAIIPTDVPFAVADDCLIEKAAFCLKRQFISTIFRSSITLDDKEDLCSKREATKHCVDQATAKCPDKTKSYMKTLLSLSQTLVEESGVCEDPAMCIAEETYGCLNNLGVAISTYEVDKKLPNLCRTYLKMEKCFAQFSPKCTGAKKARLDKMRVTLIGLMEPGICDNFVDTEVPLCPDIPEEERKCDLFEAFACLLEFNTDLLSAPSVIFLDKCIQLQKVLRCVQANVAACKEKEAYTVIDSLSKMKKRAGLVGCKWLQTEMCAKTEMCPVVDATCISDFQDSLVNEPETDICSLIRIAKKCISDNTVTCLDYYKDRATHLLDLAINKLGMPVRCDDVNFDPCLESFKAHVTNLLSKYATHDTVSKALICTQIVTKWSCISSKINGMQFAGSYSTIISSILTKVNDVVIHMCLPDTSDPACGLSKDIDSVLHFVTWLTSAKNIEKSEFCSILPIVYNQLASSTCTVVQPIHNELTAVYQQVCKVEIVCADLKSAAELCITQLSALSEGQCSKMPKCETALAEVYGHCDAASDGDPILVSYKAAVAPLSSKCQRFPQFKLLNSQQQPVYLAEGRLSTTLSLELIEAPAAGNIPSEVDFKTTIHVRTEVVNNPLTVPKCADDTEISQVVVVSQCKTVLEPPVTGDWTPRLVDVSLHARVDGKQDGRQEVTVKILADKFIEREGKMALAGTQLIASYEVVVMDRDVKNALCSSINDPHIKTFDGVTFHNMKEGTFNLYTNKESNIAVHVTYQQCAEAGTCNCRVLIRADNDVVDLNRCKTAANVNSHRPVLLDVKIHRKDVFTAGIKIYNSADMRTFHIVFWTGTIVKVKAGARYLNAWIMPSVNDIRATKGLCGMFDGNVYNDFYLPNGDRYTIKMSDRPDGALTPDDFSEAWRIMKNSVEDMSNGVQFAGADHNLPEVCDCGDGCSAMTMVATCGLVKAGSTDITSELVVKSLVNEPIGARRRRRAVPSTANDPLVDETKVPQKAGWPTKDGFTIESARALCELYVGNSTISQKCGQAMEVTGTVQDLTKSIEYCMEDIRVAGGPMFLEETLDDLMEECITNIDQDPTFQTNQQAKMVAKEVKDLSCNPVDCSGNGQCVEGSCVCTADYVGADCSILRADLQPPTITSLENDGVCEFRDSLNCSDIFINGQNFVQSELLMCHIQIVEVGQTSYEEIDQQMVLTQATVLTETQIRCSITHVGKIKHAVMISVSNDARSPSNRKLFIAFDPVCHDCDAVSATCTKMSNICEIGTNCYAAGHSSTTDRCLFCQPDENKNDWTYSQSSDCEVRRQRTGMDGIGSTVIVIIGVVTSLITLVILAIIIKILVNISSKVALNKTKMLLL